MNGRVAKKIRRFALAKASEVAKDPEAKVELGKRLGRQLKKLYNGMKVVNGKAVY